MKKVRLAIIGFGNVGQALVKMLDRKKDYIEKTYDTEVVITAVCTGRRGGVLRPEGFDATGLALSMEGDSHSADAMFDKNIDSMTIIKSGEYDIMAELTPINIMTGLPAADHIEAALRLGKHVITANKGPIAWHYRRLRDLAMEKGVLFLHEATVMDGTPVYNLAKETLMGCEITEVKGIFNATTNFILTELEKGVSFEDAVEEGRRQGFVEADPSMDVDGWDAAAKLTALMNVLMDVEITPTDIKRTGIGNITKADIDEAAAQNKKIKLLCHGWVEDGKPIGTVEPTLVDKDTLPAITSNTQSYVTITTDLIGDTTIIEEPFDPEVDQPAHGVYSDLMRILYETRR